MPDIQPLLDWLASVNPLWGGLAAFVIFILRDKGWLKLKLPSLPSAPNAPVPAPLQAPAPIVRPLDPTPVPADTVDYGDRDVRVGFVGRWFAAHMRERAMQRLVASGALPADRAAAALRRIKDETIVGHTVQTGALGDGSILARLGELLDRLTDPAFQSKIEQLVQFLMKLALLIAPLLA